ncbi:MAG: YicC/YloC family endoribonuclease [Phycisphaerales bacterium]
MTGFGEASSQEGGVTYFLEIRSLNSKYFKAVIRLPDEFQGLEAEIETELRHRLTRGSVFLTARCTDVSEDAAHDINEKALARYIEKIKKTPQVKSGELRIDLAALLTLPGVLQPPANEEQRLERTRQALLKLLHRACDGLMEMRAKEGKILLQDLMVNRDVMADRLRLVRERAPATVAEFEKRLRARIDSLLTDAGLKLDPVEIVREVAIAAERTDINEEISRLGGHIDQFSELLARDGGQPVGRTLDFVAQEMLREANTIASKCNDSEIARSIVEVKGAIDRIKEQVQNVE